MCAVASLPLILVSFSVNFKWYLSGIGFIKQSFINFTQKTFAGPNLMPTGARDKSTKRTEGSQSLTKRSHRFDAVRSQPYQHAIAANEVLSVNSPTPRETDLLSEFFRQPPLDGILQQYPPSHTRRDP